jgi:hypothetical protein
MMTVAKRLGLAAMTAPIAGLHWHKPQSKILNCWHQRLATGFQPSPNSPVIAVAGWMALVMCAAISLFVVGLIAWVLQCKIEPDTSDIHPQFPARGLLGRSYRS